MDSEPFTNYFENLVKGTAIIKLHLEKYFSPHVLMKMSPQGFWFNLTGLGHPKFETLRISCQFPDGIKSRIQVLVLKSDNTIYRTRFFKDFDSLLMWIFKMEKI
jgi:hypothetical protein